MHRSEQQNSALPGMADADWPVQPAPPPGPPPPLPDADWVDVEEHVEYSCMYLHGNRPPMLLEFSDKGHLRAQSITEDENGAKVRMVTNWHGHWEIEGNELHVGFRWKYPSDIWVHRRLQWLGNGMWRNQDVGIIKVEWQFIEYLSWFPLSIHSYVEPSVAEWLI